MRAEGLPVASTGSAGGPRGGAEPSITAVERRGIEYIPHADRWGKPSNLFWMWAGAFWNVEFVVYGALAIVVYGLSFAQAVVVILIGNLFYLLTGLASIQGPQAGTTAFGVSRAAFGPNGNRLPSFFNWATQVGFEIEGIALIVFAAILLTSKAGFTAGTAAKVLFIVLAVAIQAVLPLLGHAAVVKVLRWLAIPFVVLFALMAALTVSKVNLSEPAHGASWGALTIVLALVIAAGGLGWTENANDYSRYLPRSAGKKQIVLAVALGGAIPSALLEILGAAIATGVPTARTRGRYYRNGGIHWPAIIAQAAGMVCAALWLNAYSPYVGALASRTGGRIGSDFSVFVGMIVGGVVYYFLARRSVRAEGSATPAAA